MDFYGIFDCCFCFGGRGGYRGSFQGRRVVLFLIDSLIFVLLCCFLLLERPGLRGFFLSIHQRYLEDDEVR
ncbi:MAG: hypothetical protein EBY15_03370 [Gammaproteobacteria bacterium]|nr:hypothetical protein [Gammaproteobacteria bacterium]NDE33794.1 hypothetical protein [Gammaproteobacteria bacterium]NDE55710.1 hypothetical protein [Gammaproteobacteria bacterium]NDG86970.1 hypothetical protein [Gammaproteobacteria bacterium]